jgi:hypothetical protein
MYTITIKDVPHVVVLYQAQLPHQNTPHNAKFTAFTSEQSFFRYFDTGPDGLLQSGMPHAIPETTWQAYIDTVTQLEVLGKNMVNTPTVTPAPTRVVLSGADAEVLGDLKAVGEAMVQCGECHNSYNRFYARGGHASTFCTLCGKVNKHG